MKSSQQKIYFMYSFYFIEFNKINKTFTTRGLF